jgi:methylase of polypeptide subunit release factors
MSQYNAVIATHVSHDAAEAAIRTIAESGLDIKHFSIVGRGYHTEENAIGFYSTGDRVRF